MKNWLLVPAAAVFLSAASTCASGADEITERAAISYGEIVLSYVKSLHNTDKKRLSRMLGGKYFYCSGFFEAIRILRQQRELFDSRHAMDNDIRLIKTKEGIFFSRASIPLYGYGYGNLSEIDRVQRIDFVASLMDTYDLFDFGVSPLLGDPQKTDKYKECMSLATIADIPRNLLTLMERTQEDK